MHITDKVKARSCHRQKSDYMLFNSLLDDSEIVRDSNIHDRHKVRLVWDMDYDDSDSI